MTNGGSELGLHKIIPEQKTHSGVAHVAFVVVVVVVVVCWSHPTVRVHQKFLSPSHSELNILPDTTAGRNSFVSPDRH